MGKKVVLTESQMKRLLSEEFVEKADLSKIVSDTIKKDKDFEKKVKGIAADVVKNLFRTLWQRNNFWDSEIRN